MSARYSLGKGIICLVFLGWFFSCFAGTEVVFSRLEKCLNVFLGSSGFRKANLVSMTKATTDNDKNISTKIVSATFQNELGSEEV